mmetsp:Transcript_16500/g.23270  ORF Transcript_16500/g.23270 Transcript_16500/m.23270 type:complete len:248 (-) Transcript_16500:169-912(-)
MPSLSEPDLSKIYLESEKKRNAVVVDDDDDVVSVTSTEVSFVSTSTDYDVLKRTPLQWEFHGLTLWLEPEEFDSDLSTAIRDASKTYGLEPIPNPHLTAIYGIKHLSIEEARIKLQKIPLILPNGKWPIFDRPVGVKTDIAIEGRPGQVCSIAWAELTMSSNEHHEEALDELRNLFECKDERHRPWTPHNSIAYDNPEDTILTLEDTIMYCAKHPTLLSRKRNVKAISLWNTQGKMSDWKFIDRVFL